MRPRVLALLCLALALGVAIACPGSLPAETFFCERDVECAAGHVCDRSGGLGRCRRLGPEGPKADSGAPAADAGEPTDAGEPPAPDAGTCPWWSCAHRQRMQLRFDNATRGDLDDFPALVVLAPLRFPYADAAADGSDLRFVDDDDATPLPFEVERWDPAGASYLWVRVPRIDGASTDDHIWLYFDAEPGEALPPRPREPVWDEGFVGVWHLDQGAADSSVNGNHGAPAGSEDADGQVAGAQDFDDVEGDPIYVADHESLDTIDNGLTLSAWVLRQQAHASWRAVLSRLYLGTAGDHFHFGFLDNDFQLHVFNGVSSGQARLGPALTDRWYHVAGTWDGIATSLYVDGELIAQVNGPSPPLVDDTQPLWIAGDSNDNNASTADRVDAVLDEVRLSRVRRSPDFLRAERAAGLDALLQYGAPEARPAGVLP